MNESFSETDLVEALFKTIAGVLDELHYKGTLSADEYTLLTDSIWQELGYGSRLPK